MRFLLDTNVFIYREDDRVLSDDMQQLLRTLNEIKAEILTHPLSIEELEKDQDKGRQEIVLSKLQTYPPLKSPPDPGKDRKYLDAVGRETGINDRIDNAILYSVYKDAVDFLITEDRGIHKKASRLEIDDRVFLINDALQIFREYLPKEKMISPPALREEPVHNLNLEDPIFNSLRQDYGCEVFEDWFRKVSREGRKCLVHFRDDGSIGALLIYKVEDEPIDSAPPLPKKKRLKLSTFKVTHVGHKVGELFIKLSIDLCIKNEILEIYLTHFTETEDRLVELISEYGFYKAAVNPRGEDIFIKRLVVDGGETELLSLKEVADKFYPSFNDGVRVNKFIIPIRPEYHEMLFTDFQKRQTKLREHSGDFIVEGNTIKKAYLCHAKARRMKSGDIVLFYRSRDLRKITSLGVVETVSTGIKDCNKILRLVGKRTVYSRDGIAEMAKRPVTVILFRHHFHLKNPLSFEELKAMGVLVAAPQSIIKIQHKGYIKIKERGEIDERFTVH